MASKKSKESALLKLEAGDDGSFSYEFRSNTDRMVRVVRRSDAQQAPVVEGDTELSSSPAIVNALWLAAVGQLEAEALEEELTGSIARAKSSSDFDEDSVSIEKQKNRTDKSVKSEVKRRERRVKKLRNQAEGSAKLAISLVELMDTLGDRTEQGWCSLCFTYSRHRKSASKSLYVCKTCGSATTQCRVPKCENFAARDLGSRPSLQFCGEHLHQVPDFGRLEYRIDDLTEWRELRKFKVANVARVVKLSATAVSTMALGATGGLVAAPLVGSAVGTTFLGLSGAAAQNAGLAALGFGSLASGGMGMAGGSMVVAAAGGLLSSAFGVNALNSYIGEDSSFDIKCVRKGSGTPVLIARGFTTEKKTDWRTELQAVEKAYPDSSIYLVSWGSKEIHELAGYLSPGVGLASGAMLKSVVKRAGKKLAKKATPVGLALGSLDLVTNPWTSAVKRADKTAVALAAIMQRTDLESVVLIGHSLGGRIMLKLATALAGTVGTEHEIRLEAVHLLGAAIGQDATWNSLGNALTGTVHNYYSHNDIVLKRLYPAAMFGRKAIGFTGLDAPFAVNHDVSDRVKSHSAYYSNVELVRS